jgi:hypothetical protein
MALSNRYFSLARPDRRLTEYRFKIYSMENGLYKLQSYDQDPTVESKVMILPNRYSSLARPDFLLTEYRFHIHS